MYNLYFISIIAKLQVESYKPERKERSESKNSLLRKEGGEEGRQREANFKSPPFKSSAYCEQCREMAACSFLARGRDSSPRSVCVRVCSFHALEKREVPRWARGGQNEKGESERKCALLKFRKSIGDDASGAIDAASWIRLRASIGRKDFSLFWVRVCQQFGDNERWKGRKKLNSLWNSERISPFISWPIFYVYDVTSSVNFKKNLIDCFIRKKEETFLIIHPIFRNGRRRGRGRRKRSRISIQFPFLFSRAVKIVRGC